MRISYTKTVLENRRCKSKKQLESENERTPERERYVLKLTLNDYYVIKNIKEIYLMPEDVYDRNFSSPTNKDYQNVDQGIKLITTKYDLYFK